MAFSVYILYSARADRYYVGHTSDVERRLLSHNSSDEIGGRYTRKNGYRLNIPERHPSFRTVSLRGRQWDSVLR